FITPGTFGHTPFCPKKSYPKDGLYGGDEHFADTTSRNYFPHNLTLEEYYSRLCSDDPPTPPQTGSEETDFANTQECDYNPSAPDFDMYRNSPYNTSNYYSNDFSQVTDCPQLWFDGPYKSALGCKNPETDGNHRVVKTPPGFAGPLPRTATTFSHSRPQSASQPHRFCPPSSFRRPYSPTTPPPPSFNWQCQSRYPVSNKSIPKRNSRGIYNPHTDEWIHTHDWYPGCGFGYGDDLRDADYNARLVDGNQDYDVECSPNSTMRWQD